MNSTTAKLVIIDYGMGNIGSVANAFKRLDAKFHISNDPQSLIGAKGIVLPGVGAFPAAMKNLKALGFQDVLQQEVFEKKKPYLGICLGMQLVALDSVEQELTKGLGWIEGNVVKIETSTPLPVPHVGWNVLTSTTRENPFLEKIGSDAHFYFDHSFRLKCPKEYVVATCDYGGDIVAAIQKDNIFAVQFHPEKSQRSGLKILRNFINFLGRD